jgi:hypothetical protein
MAMVLSFSVMNELDPLSDLEIVHCIDGHVSFAGVSSRDLVYRCL